MWTPEQLRIMSMRGAAGLLAVRGYGNVHAAELARAGGLSVGTMYRRHGSKQGYAQTMRAHAERQLCHWMRGGFEMGRATPGAAFREAFQEFWWGLADW